MKPPRHILILGGDADGNLGDRAILWATCAELRALGDAQVTAVLRDGDDFVRHFGTRVVRRGWRGLLGLVAAARRSDLVFCGGGGLFQDDDSLVKMPYWAVRLLLMRTLGRRVLGYSIGAGPLDATSSRWAARLAFACMTRVSVRDEPARAIAAPLSRTPVEVVPDPALLIPPASDAAALQALRDHGVDPAAGPIIGAAPRRYFPAQRRVLPHFVTARLRGRRDWGRTAAASRPLIELWAAALDAAIDRTGARVLMLPTYCKQHEADALIADEVRAAMRHPTPPPLRITDPALYRAVAGKLALMVGGRMHATILAAAAGTPVVGVAYNQKFQGFFGLIGRPQDVIDVSHLLHDRRAEPFADLIVRTLQDPPDYGDAIAELTQRTRWFLRESLEQAA